MGTAIQSVQWKDGKFRIIDQTELPLKLVYRDLGTAEEVWEAIKKLRVRGAPAIGIAGAFGLYLGVRDYPGDDYEGFLAQVEKVADYLATSRPTAVNLFWALERMKKLVRESAGLPVSEIKKRMLAEAQKMIEEDIAVCRAIGEHGAELIADGYGILTHCNTGSLATGRWGTALGVIYVAAEQGKRIHVYSDETRPLLQGSRLTTWELMQAGIPVTQIADDMAATVMAQGKVDIVLVGTDRVAANGDFANKIGTLGVAILAKEFGIPFFVAAPLSSIDMSLPSGEGIPIEERNPDEVRTCFGKPIAPPDVDVYNPAFDVTPHRYVTGIITEKGIIYPPYEVTLARLMEAD